MGNPGAYYHSVTIQALTVFSLVAVFAADHVHGGNDGCSHFSCGHLQNISYPFRRRGDPVGCGAEAYELVCTSSKATIQINTGTYYVTAINYTGSYFWVMDPNYDTNSSCPLPQWNHLPYSAGKLDSHGFWNLETRSGNSIACFANCSRAVMNNNAYKPVTCLGANNSHVYVWVSRYGCPVGELEPYCGYRAMIPFSEDYSSFPPGLHNARYADITQLVSKGFIVEFPLDTNRPNEKLRIILNICLNNSISYFKEQISSASIMNWTHAFFWSEVPFLECVTQYSYDHNYTTTFVLVVATIVSPTAIPKFLFGT
ncbi:uncharacterized protein [Lolium perenne]|uniref:uncharacterized protein n=1 Tax=Lolium perenne TaxID=4522 RepID=UPI0021F5A619|nr:uncharacterized protein LOC127341374 isoform X1 [Lolium perenne]